MTDKKKIGLGTVIMCFSSALYFTVDMGVSTYDAASLILSEKRKWKFRICRISSDLFCTIVGFAFGATVGIGTFVTAFLYQGSFFAAWLNFQPHFNKCVILRWAASCYDMKNRYSTDRGKKFG